MGFDLRFSDKEITAWGGMAIMKRMLDHLGFDAALTAAELPQPRSNRGYRPEQLMTQFMLSIWCGANRFEHGEVTRHDPVLKRVFGFARMANFKAVMRLLQRALVDAQDWWCLHDEAGKPVQVIELNRFMYQANAWSKPRWIVGIRQHIDQRASAKGKTLSLFADDPVIGKYRFSALVTDLDLPAVTVWRTYRGRADCENRIKELKYDFAADSFNMKDFWATEAALNTVMLAYNLMSLMRQV